MDVKYHRIFRGISRMTRLAFDKLGHLHPKKKNQKRLIMSFIFRVARDVGHFTSETMFLDIIINDSTSMMPRDGCCGLGYTLKVSIRASNTLKAIG